MRYTTNAGNATMLIAGPYPVQGPDRLVQRWTWLMEARRTIRHAQHARRANVRRLKVEADGKARARADIWGLTGNA